MSVGIAEVSGVDPPGAIMGLVGERGSSGLGLGEHSIDVRLARDGVADAEFSGPRRTGRDLRVLCQLGARIEAEDHVALQLEHHDRPIWLELIADELGADHPSGLQSEALAVEGERSLQIRDSERDDVDSRLHPPPFPFGSHPTC